MAGSVQQSEAAVAAGETAAHANGRSASSAVPVVPALPRPTSKSSSTGKAHEVSETTDAGDKPAVNGAETAGAEATDDAPASPPVKSAPTSWANLFAKPSAKGAANSASPNGTSALLNGGPFDAAGAISGSAFSKANATSLAEAIRAYRVDSGDKISFLEPRGLINTGNMCYMNSVRHPTRNTVRV